jgi:hypothetical protein
MTSERVDIERRWTFERRTLASGEPIDVLGPDATVPQAVTDIAVLLRREGALKAMIEQMPFPQHDAAWCGSNDCRACEWLAIANTIDWPGWRDELRRKEPTDG